MKQCQSCKKVAPSTDFGGSPKPVIASLPHNSSVKFDCFVCISHAAQVGPVCLAKTSSVLDCLISLGQSCGKGGPKGSKAPHIFHCAKH